MTRVAVSIFICLIVDLLICYLVFSVAAVITSTPWSSRLQNYEKIEQRRTEQQQATKEKNGEVSNKTDPFI